jgi:phosphatidate cytidylyltransferase
MTKELKNRILTSFFLLSLLILMNYHTYILIISLIIIFLITWIEFYGLISKILKKNDLHEKILRILLKFISLCFLFFLSFVIVSNYLSDSKFFLVYSIFVAIMSDIGGLMIGRVFKGKKLTKISPKKTISGSLGAFTFSILLIPIFFKNLLINDYLILVTITLIISLTSQLGDLFISLLKRKANVKNTSNLLPGHGGFLDRIDGIIFAIPIGILLFSFFK